MLKPILTPEEVRIYLSDSPEANHLLDGEEFSDPRIQLAMDMALGDFNSMAPVTGYTYNMFPNKSILLFGTCFHLFSGQAALQARNTMQYSDGGLQIPVEERYELYMNLANHFGSLFQNLARQVKTQINLDENGWGSVSSDYGRLPLF